MTQAVTANREIERGATEAESTLASLRETTQRELSALRETHGRLVAWNAEEQAAIDADVQHKADLDAALIAAQKTLADLTIEVESTQKKVADGEKKVREERELKRAEEERQVKALQAATVAEAGAKEALVAARAGLNDLQVSLVFASSAFGRTARCSRHLSAVVLRDGFPSFYLCVLSVITAVSEIQGGCDMLPTTAYF